MIFWFYDKHRSSIDPKLIRANLLKVSNSIDFWNYKRKRKEIIKAMFDVFKNIQIVSAILRFVIPEGFGIYSPHRRISFRGETREKEL